MAKKRSGSSVQEKRPAKKRKNTGDEGIDFSDIPELTLAQLKKGKRVGRPKSANPKQLIAVRLAPSLLYALRLIAKKKKRPYQTVLHEMLEQAVKEAA